MRLTDNQFVYFLTHLSVEKLKCTWIFVQVTGPLSLDTKACEFISSVCAIFVRVLENAVLKKGHNPWNFYKSEIFIITWWQVFLQNQSNFQNYHITQVKQFQIKFYEKEYSQNYVIYAWVYIKDCRVWVGGWAGERASDIFLLVH